MAGTINKVQLIGNLGGPPTVKNFDNGGLIAKFTLATSETYTNKATGDKVTDTQWHSITTSGKLAENVEKYLDKGSKVFVEGKLKTRTFEKDGVKRYFTEIQAKEVVFLSPSSNGSDNHNAINTPPEEEPDDLPF